MRLIDADVLAAKWQDVLDEKADEKETVAYMTFELLIDRLKEEPTIDAVPIVRCKDCARGKEVVCMENARYCTRYREVFDGADFCSYGERREHD